MFRRRFFPTLLAAGLIVILLAFGGYALLQTGISRGYALGLEAGGAEVVPQLPPAGYYPAYGFAPFWGFGIARFFFGLLIFFLLVRLLFLPWMFRRSHWGYRRGGKWGHRHWGPPPWADHPTEGDEAESEGPEPEQT